MREKIENRLYLVLEGAPTLDLCLDLVVWIKQRSQFFEYKPHVLSATELFVEVPYEDAMKLRKNRTAEIQVAGTDESDNKWACDIVEVTVSELLKQEGYDGADST